jgi:hypothetical protein
MKEHKFEI